MARKVFVTSDMAVDERLAAVADQSDLAALMWPWFLANLDDWGRCRVEPRRLKAQVWPSMQSVTVAVVHEALSLWHQAGLIELYEVGRRWYAEVEFEKWKRFQTHIRWDRKGDGQSSQCPANPRSVSDDGTDERQVSLGEFTPGTIPAGAGNIRETAGKELPPEWPNISLSTFAPGSVPDNPGNSVPSPSPTPSREDSLRSSSRADPNERSTNNGQISSEVWDTLTDLFGQPAPQHRPLWARVGHYLDNELTGHPDPAAEIHRRATAIIQTWNGTSKLTIASLEKHWSRFDGQVGSMTDDQAMTAIADAEWDAIVSAQKGLPE